MNAALSRPSFRPTMDLRSLGAFLQELRKRHVIKVLVAYTAVWIVVIQVAGVVAPALRLPEWTVGLIIFLGTLGLPFALILAWAYDLTPQGLAKAVPAAESDIPASATSESASTPINTVPAATVPVPPLRPVSGKSIAVLPFADLSGDRENRYFADGITEEIIATLAKIGELKVISRTSVQQYRDAQQNVREIGAALGVRMVLEGSVRRSGNRVRIVAQLIDASGDEHLWAETYDRRVEDIFDIQSDVATRIAQAMNAVLSPEERIRLSLHPTQDVEAYDLYLRGRHAWNLRTPAGIDRSLLYFEQALERDPGFALARASLAGALVTIGIYGWRGPADVMPRARVEVDRALSLDASLPDAVATRGAIRALHDWDWQGAEADFRHALSLNPTSETVHQWFAMNFLLPHGRFEEARAALERARTIAPVSPSVSASFGVVSYFQRDTARAIDELERLLELHPGYGLAHQFIGMSLEALNRFADGEIALRRAVELSGRSVETVAALAHLLARSGREDEARGHLGTLIARAPESYVSPVQLAHVHAGLGEVEHALARLEEGAASRATDLVWIGLRQSMDPLRLEPRFQSLLRRLDVPGASVAG